MPLKGKIVSSRDVFEIGEPVNKRGEKFFVVGRKRLADAYQYTVLPEAEYLESLMKRWVEPVVVMPELKPFVPKPWWKRLIEWVESSWL
jgi:hypothetical protein